MAVSTLLTVHTAEIHPGLVSVHIESSAKLETVFVIGFFINIFVNKFVELMFKFTMINEQGETYLITYYDRSQNI